MRCPLCLSGIVTDLDKVVYVENDEEKNYSSTTYTVCDDCFNSND